MTSVMDVLYNLLRFLGLLGEPPSLRKNFKRNRVYDDFSSDDETPVLGYKQVKRFRWSDIIDLTDNCDKDNKHSNSVRNVPDPVEHSYTTSTPNESPRQTVPLDQGSSRDGPTTPIKKTTPANPVIDAEVFMEQKKPTVWSKTQKKPSIVHVDLDENDSDDDQQDNDVVFVKKVISPPASPHKHSLAESNHAEALNDDVLPKTLEELKPEIKLDYQNLLWGIAKTNIKKTKSKRKPEVDGKLADATSPHKIQVNKSNEIKLADAISPQKIQINKSDEIQLADATSPQKIQLNQSNEIKLAAATSLQKIHVNKSNEITLADAISPQKIQINKSDEIQLADATSPQKIQLNQSNEIKLAGATSPQKIHVNKLNKIKLADAASPQKIQVNKLNEIKLADATSPQLIQVNKLNEIKLDSELKAVLPITLKELKPEIKLDYQNLLWGIAKTNIQEPMSKRKPDGDAKLAGATSPQKIHVNKLNEIKLDHELNSGRQQNASKADDPVRISSSDSSDSDVEEVPPVFSTMSSVRKDLERKSRNWLLELDSQYNKVQNTVDKINDARRVSVILSKVNSDQNVARSPRAEETEISEILLPKLGSKCNIEQSGRNEALSSSPDTINDFLARLDAKYFSTPKPPAKLHDVQPNEAQSSKSHMTEDWLAKLESKYKTDQLKAQDRLRETFQEPEVVSVKSDLDTTREWLANLEAEYAEIAWPQKTQENNSNARHVSTIVPKVNNERKHVFTVESEYEKVLSKTQDQLDDALQESDIPKKNSETNEARSYLPADAQDWLTKLDAQYKTASKKQEDLNQARQALKNVSKVNVQPIDHGSPNLNSVDHWLGELLSKYNVEQPIGQQEPNTTRCSETVPKVESEKGETQSQLLETARQRLSKLDSKTELSKTQIIRDDTYQEVTNLSNVNNGQNEARSFKFNNSEDLMTKLGFLYNSYQQEANEKSNSSSGHEHTKSKDEDSEMELQSNELPVLTPEQEKLVESGLEPEPEDELLMEKFNMRIHRRDLQTLADENWLNDEVINFYMNLIMQRSEERKDLPKVFAMNTFFYPKLMQSGQAGLRRWTRKVDIFAYDLFVVPINVGRHWCLCLVDFRARVMNYLDSQGRPDKECLEALMQYLKDEHQDKKGTPFDNRSWKAVCPTDIPQQMNGSDCGMFACTFAEFSSRDAAYSFTQAHMPYLRRKAALEILTGKLLL